MSDLVVLHRGVGALAALMVAIVGLAAAPAIAELAEPARITDVDIVSFLKEAEAVMDTGDPDQIVAHYRETYTDDARINLVMETPPQADGTPQTQAVSFSRAQMIENISAVLPHATEYDYTLEIRSIAIADDGATATAEFDAQETTVIKARDPDGAFTLRSHGASRCTVALSAAFGSLKITRADCSVHIQLR